MVLRERAGQPITVDTQGGSAGGLAQLCSGEINIAMSSKPIADSDRQQFPNCNYQPVKIREDTVGIVVRREVYDAGVRNVTREQARAVFEARITNWRELGGPDLGIFVYDKEPGRGTREMLDQFLYGPDGDAPPPDSDRFAVVGGNEETRAKLLSTPGAVGPLSTSFVAGYPELGVLTLEGVAAANLDGDGQQVLTHLPLVERGVGQTPGDQHPVWCGGQVELEPPVITRVGGAQPVSTGSGDLAAFDCLLGGSTRPG